ncbi:ribosome dissociation factor GTPase HBS1 [Nakaseomyces bracarensis]|uniref:ribosome dissociation factor GTPase HBS1 n=1 Tax=Nakaseomyces bracarensis TaxID=273131 RepID=UPI003871A403
MSYDDDYISDEMPDFQDENEFDDYLNDEEYELMSSIFPQAKKEMSEYQGWDNLAVKLAIFDNDFDLDAAVTQLKRDFKKKKPKKEVAAQESSKILADKVSKLSVSDKKDDMWMDLDDEQPRKVAEEEEEDSKIVYKKATVPTKPKKPIDIEKYLLTSKPHLSFVVLGHVDAGKSTLMGRVLQDVGAVDKSYIRKLKKESETIGKGSFHLAWVMDQTSEERERGVTVSICTSDFNTDSANFTIVDAPGHRDFVPNAIAGVSQADVAILSIDCGINAFESGFNLDGQTKEHAILAKSMDITKVIVAMNKMDSVQWSENRYQDIQQKLNRFLIDIGFKEDQLLWVPCSGFTGQGVHKIPYPEEANWYKGLTVIETLENVASGVGVVSYDEIKDSSFIFSILESSASNKNEEAVISGKVESGSIQPGETITIYPSEQSVLVDKIISGKEQNQVPIAVKGEFVTLKLRHAHPEDIQGGDIAASVDFEISAYNKFNLRMQTFNMNRPLLPGTPFMLFRGVCEQPARVSKLISLVDKEDYETIIKKKVRHLGSNQAAIVEIELTEKRRWIPLLTFSQNEHIGRIVCRKDGRTIAAGTIIP